MLCVGAQAGAFTAAPSSLSPVPAGGNATNLTLTAVVTNWSANVSSTSGGASGGGGVSSFIALNATTGSTTVGPKVTVQPFTGNGTRRAFVNLISPATTGSLFVVGMNQSGLATNITPDPFTVSGNVINNVPGVGNSTPFLLYANTAWTATVDPGSTSWLGIDILSGGGNTSLGNTGVTVSVQANVGAARSGNITFTATSVGAAKPGGGTYTTIVNVNQLAGQPTLTITPTSANISNNGAASQQISVNSNVNWTAPVTDQPTWVTNISVNSTAVGGNYTGSANITYSVAANPSVVARAASINITGSSGTGIKTFSIFQDGATPFTSIDPTSASYLYPGGSGNVNVTSNLIGWSPSVSGNDSWIIPASGPFTGNTVLTYTVRPNNGNMARDGNIVINTQSFAIHQDFGTSSLVPANVTVPSNGNASAVVQVITGQFGWTAVSENNWIVVTNKTGGGNETDTNGNVTYSVASNPNNSSRLGSIMINGLAFNVTQSAAPSVTTINPTGASYSNLTANGTIAITSNEQWIAASNVTWAHLYFNGNIVPEIDGNLSSNITYSVDENTGTSNRAGTINISSNVNSIFFTITQNGTPAFTIITPTSKSFPQAGGDNSPLVINTNTNWTAVPSDTWITVNDLTGNSGESVTAYSVAPNTLTSNRTGNITINGKVLQISQNGLANVTNVSPLSSNVGSGGGKVNIAVTSNVQWTASSNATWATITSGASGTGNGTVAVTITGQPGPDDRVAMVTVNESSATIIQSGTTPFFRLTPGAGNYTVAGASNQTISVVSNTDWTGTIGYVGVGVPVDWVTFNTSNGTSNTTSGSGNGTVSFNVDANFFVVARNANISIGSGVGGTKFKISQPASATNVTISPTSNLNLPATGSGMNGTYTGTIDVMANVPWSATPSVPWITNIQHSDISTNTTSTGYNGTVNYDVLPNNTVGTRTGMINVGGKSLTVSQLGINATTSLQYTSKTLDDGQEDQGIALNVTSNVPWTANSSASWLTITSGNSSSGNATMKYGVTANPTVANRTANITVKAPPNTLVCTITQPAGDPVATAKPTSAVFNNAGATNQKVSISSNAPWNATVDANASGFVTIVGNTTGPIGNGTLTYTVAPSNVGYSRLGNIVFSYGNTTIATLKVSQSGITPILSVNPTSQNVTADLTPNLTIDVTSNTLWDVSTLADWIDITDNGTGVGNGTITYTIANNTLAFARADNINIGGLGFEVFQEASPLEVSFDSPGNSSVPAGGANGLTFNVTSNDNWTAVASDSWITILSGGPIVGNGTVTFAVSANGFAASRSGNIVVSGLAYNITQLGASESTNLDPTSNTYVSNGALNQTIVVTSNANWTTTVSDDSWISVTGGNTGSGNGNVTFDILPNSTNATRNGSLMVNGAIFLITQSASNSSTTPPSFNLSYPAFPGQVITVTSSGNWTAITDSSWITFNGSTAGSGNGTVTFNVAKNNTHDGRSGNVIIDGQVTEVDQDPAPDTDIAPDSFALGASAALGLNITVTSAVDWTAVSDAGFIHVTGNASGSGNGTVVFNVDANGSVDARSGNITIDGQVAEISQAAAAASTLISPTTKSVPASASANLTITVTSNVPWTATSGASWLTITGGNSGSGNGNVTYNVAANSGSARSSNITVNGQVCTISQAAPSTSISPTTKSVSANATAGLKITVTSNTNWTAKSSNTTVVIITAGTSGVGNGTVTYKVTKNNTTAKRVFKITVNGKVCTITQAAKAATGKSRNPTSESTLHIVTQPKSVQAAKGATVNFSVTATGTPPFAYAWAKDKTKIVNGANITGATTRTLKLTKISSASVGIYTVQVSNEAGKLTSAKAHLTLQP